MATEELLDTLSACQYQNAGFSFASEHLTYICICFSPVYWQPVSHFPQIVPGTHYPLLSLIRRCSFMMWLMGMCVLYPQYTLLFQLFGLLDIMRMWMKVYRCVYLVPKVVYVQWNLVFLYIIQKVAIWWSKADNSHIPRPSAKPSVRREIDGPSTHHWLG